MYRHLGPLKEMGPRWGCQRLANRLSNLLRSWARKENCCSIDTAATGGPQSRCNNVISYGNLYMSAQWKFNQETAEVARLFLFFFAILFLVLLR